MSIINAILLGIIQGLTEFLPVSSSGHLVLFQKIFSVEEPALLFDTMLHVGTLVAVFAVLWKDIWAILKKPIQPLTAYLILATIPTVIAALVFRKPLERAFETGEFLGFCFLITSALLATAELLSKRQGATLKKHGEMNWLDSLVIGVMQAIAVIPGISRSGATLSGALSRGLNRDFAARFSFLMSIPAILGAAVFHLKDLVKDSAATEAAEAANSGIGAGAMVAGTLAAAIVGFFAVRLMLKIIREKSLWGFAIYTGILGLLVLIDQFAVHLVF
ncbi:MAG: undecaprenyl-diphosphate phosphatase [Treponema sp.]|jgi:undecaprenyl-diphosphatase|nr:undecaprenyl-diphosphate phosphatase [Treponema sp.]